MTTTPRPGTHLLSTARKVGLTSALVVVTVAALAACSSSSKSSSNASAASSAPSSGSGSGRTGQPAPAAFGLAAAISGNTIEVQDPSTGQVSVTYSTSTKFTQSKKETVATLAAGDCITAVGAPPASGSASASAPAAQPTTFTATSITVVASTNGSCTGGGFGGGARPSGSARPSGAPSGSGSGAARGGFGTFASGKIQSVSGATIVLQVTNRSTNAVTQDTITTTSATTVTTTAPATAAALKVGECVTATGPTNDTGAVTASRIALSTPGPNGCTAGFGRRGASASGGSNA